MTPLHRAAENGHLDTVTFLVSKGADVNAEDNVSLIIIIIIIINSIPV